MKPVTGVRRIALVLAVWAAGCTSETGIVSLEPTLVVQPDALDFGPVVAGVQTTPPPGAASATLSVRIANTGQAELVADLTLEGEDPGAFSLDPALAHLELEPDEGVDVPVTFDPAEVGDYTASLVVASNDTQQALLPVGLAGEGRVPYRPDIEIVPGGTIHFGDVAVEDRELAFFEIRNVGDADLRVGTITQTGAGTFSLDADYSGTTIAPGDGRPIVLTYAPIQPGGDSGRVVIPSNDEDEPEVTVALEANGGGTFEYPEAVIDCPGRVEVAGPLVVTLDGSASADPSGEALTFSWATVRRPDAADQAATPSPVDAPVTDVRIDAAGTWEVQLQVTNASGVPSVPTKCVIEAVPKDELHVELSWAGPTSDLDLHLSLEDAALFEVPGDVSFCNAAPDWGVAGERSDDPSLDLDDDDGFGPENVNLPAPADGVYPVRVHYFDDRDDGDVTARVTVFAYGAAIWSGSQVLRRNEVWEVGQVNWPDGTFGVGAQRPADAEVRSCE